MCGGSPQSNGSARPLAGSSGDGSGSGRAARVGTPAQAGRISSGLYGPLHGGKPSEQANQATINLLYPNQSKSRGSAANGIGGSRTSVPLGNPGYFTGTPQELQRISSRSGAVGLPSRTVQHKSTEFYTDEAGKTRSREVTETRLYTGLNTRKRAEAIDKAANKEQISNPSSPVMKRNLASIGTRLFAPLSQDRVTLGV